MGADAAGRFYIGVPVKPEDVFEVKEVTYSCKREGCPTVAGGGKEKPKFCSECGAKKAEYTKKLTTLVPRKGWEDVINPDEWEDEAPIITKSRWNKGNIGKVNWTWLFRSDEYEEGPVEYPGDLSFINLDYNPWDDDPTPTLILGVQIGSQFTGNIETSSWDEVFLLGLFSKVSTEAEKRGIQANPRLYVQSYLSV